MVRGAIAALLALGLLGLANARAPFMAPLDAAPDACQACMVSVRLFEDFLCDPAATDFLVDFVEKQICPAMGDTEQCHNLAEGLLPTVVQWFRASATPASLCSSAGVCGAKLAEIPMLNKPSLRVHDGAECAMCKFVVERVKTALNDSQTLDKIKDMALQVCGGLPQELANSCSEFVNDYEPMIAELIESMDPDTVCSLVGVCMEALVAHPPPPLTEGIVRLLAQSQALRRPHPSQLSLAMASLGMPGPFMMPPPREHGGLMGGLMHLFCHVFGFGHHGPHGPHPEPEPQPRPADGPHPEPEPKDEGRTSMVGGAAMTGPMGGAAMTGPMGGAAMTGPMGGAAMTGPMGGAAMTGPMGGMMGGPMGGMMEGRGLQAGPMMGGPMMMDAANDACDYCKMAVIEAHSLISNPSVQAEVLNYTLAVCDSFPSFEAPCKTYVTLYAPLVFTMLEQYLVPDTVCAQTGMCPPPPAPGAESEGALVDMDVRPPHAPGPLGWLVEGLRGLAAHLRILPPPVQGAAEDGVNPAALTKQEPEPEAAPRVEPPQ